MVGFTGSAIWHYVAMFPPVADSVIQAGYADFADRWNPILDVSDEVGVAVRTRGAPRRDRLRLLDHRCDLSTGRGDTESDNVFRMLNSIGYRGPISIEWDDAGMDRLDGAPEALDFVRKHNAIMCRPLPSTPHSPAEPTELGWYADESDVVGAGRGTEKCTRPPG